MGETLTAKTHGKSNAGAFLLAAGVMFGVAYWLSHRTTEEDTSLMEWIRATNPGLSETEYQSLEAYWLTHAKLIAAQQAEIDADLPGAATDAATTDSAAADAAVDAIANPTDADAQAAADAAAAEAAAALQRYIDGLNSTLAVYEAAWNETQGRLSTAEANYNSTLKAYSDLADYIQWRINRVGREVFVWTDRDLSGPGYGVPWGDWSSLSELGIPNDAIESARLIKGARVIFYEHSDFGGASWEYDAAESDVVVGDMGTYRNKMSSLQVMPSMRAYERERDAALGVFNTCYTALVGIQGEIATLQSSVLSLSRDIGIVTYFSARCSGLLDRINAVVARLNSQYTF